MLPQNAAYIARTSICRALSEPGCDQSLSFGGTTFGNIRFDITIEGRDALIVRNNIADLTASVSLRVSGDAENPQITGRIIANGARYFSARTDIRYSAACSNFRPRPISNRS